MQKKLFLFDIDGILMKVGLKPPADYWQASLKKYFAVDVSINEVYNIGKTDKAILTEMLAVKGVKRPDAEKLRKSLQAVGEIGGRFIEEHGVAAVENADKFVAALKRSSYVGLLTGNCRQRALAKIKGLGLQRYFSPVIGAFGEQAAKRSNLVEIAMKDAEQKTGIKFAKVDVYLIGDSVRDIWCAKEAGVKVIAVATGPESLEALKKETPDYLFKDFSDVEGMVLQVLEG